MRTLVILVFTTPRLFYSSLSMNFENALWFHSGPGGSGWPQRLEQALEALGRINKGAQILNWLPTLPAESLIHAFVNSWLPSAPLWSPPPNFQLFRKPQLPVLCEHSGSPRSQACDTRKRLSHLSHPVLYWFINIFCPHTYRIGRNQHSRSTCSGASLNPCRSPWAISDCKEKGNPRSRRGSGGGGHCHVTVISQQMSGRAGASLAILIPT